MRTDAMWKHGDPIGVDADGVEYRLFAEYEGDIAPEDSFCDEADIAFARSGGDWAWCRVCIIAKHEDHDEIGADYLGGCSYASRADFVAGPYFTDMKYEARADLLANLERRAHPTPDATAADLLARLDAHHAP